MIALFWGSERWHDRSVLHCNRWEEAVVSAAVLRQIGLIWRREPVGVAPSTLPRTIVGNILPRRGTGDPPAIQQDNIIGAEDRDSFHLCTSFSFI